MCQTGDSDVPGRETETCATIRYAANTHERAAGALLLLNDEGAKLAASGGRVRSGTAHGDGVLWVIASPNGKEMASAMFYPAAKAEEMEETFKTINAQKTDTSEGGAVQVAVVDAAHSGYTLRVQRGQGARADKGARVQRRTSRARRGHGARADKGARVTWGRRC